MTNTVQTNPFQFQNAQVPAPTQGQPGQFAQPAPGYQPQSVMPSGYGQPQGIMPVGAGSPMPFGAPTQPAGYGAPAPMPVGPGFNPFAAVQTASLTRGQKLYLRGDDLAMAEIVRVKVQNGQKGMSLIFELRVLWSKSGKNAIGSEPSVVLKQTSHYFGSEVKTWMCALLGLVGTRDKAEIDRIDATANQWSQLCSLACYSPDGQMQGPGPFAGSIVLLDCYRKLKVDRYGTPKVLQAGEDTHMDLARPEPVNPQVGAALRYLRACTNLAQDPAAAQHYEVVRAAAERRLEVPAYDPDALARRMQGSAPAQGQSQPAPLAAGYAQTPMQQPAPASGWQQPR
jgi:hypothetical protein